MTKQPYLTLPLILAAWVSSAQGQLPVSGSLDDAVFREGLREWGLTAWLDQYLADTPARDAVDESLRNREKLLDEARHPDISASRCDALVTEASGELEALLKKKSATSLARVLVHRARS